MVLALLALIGIGAGALALSRTGGGQQPSRQELDEAAEAACAVFEPTAAEIRAGTLQGRPLYRALQDVYNQAQRSTTEGFAQQVAELNSSAINGDAATLRDDVIALQLACR